MDMRIRRSSSPGYIDSPTYSRQGMSPIMPRSPQHYYRYGESLLLSRNKKHTLIPDLWDAHVTSLRLHQKTMQVDQHVLLVNNMDSGPALTSLNQHTSLSWSFQQEWLENYTEYAVYWEIYYIFIALPSLYIL